MYKSVRLKACENRHLERISTVLAAMYDMYDKLNAGVRTEMWKNINTCYFTTDSCWCNGSCSASTLNNGIVDHVQCKSKGQERLPCFSFFILFYLCQNKAQSNISKAKSQPIQAKQSLLPLVTGSSVAHQACLILMSDRTWAKPFLFSTAI